MLARLASDLSLRHIIPHQRRLRALTTLARVYQRSGMQSLVRKSGSSAGCPRRSRRWRSPCRPSQALTSPQGQTLPAIGDRRARVALLSGCVMPLFNGPEMDAVVRVLNRNGCEVVVPKDQVCCGAIHSHVGDLDTARELARRNLDVFADAGAETLIVASAGCGARMKEYGHLLRDDEKYSDRAARFVETVKDINEFLVDLPFQPPQGELSCRVTYQDSCHLGNSQRITSAPRQILKSIRALNSSSCRRRTLLRRRRHLHDH